MIALAGLHVYGASRQIGEKQGNLIAPELLAQYDLTFGVNAVELKDIFAKSMPITVMSFMGCPCCVPYYKGRAIPSL
jgi:hypothetical protein